MPNTSCAVGKSAKALSAGRYATTAHLEAATRLFAAVGHVVTVAEELMDAVTGLSGSGPAYIHLFLEALTEAGAALGLDPEVSFRMALQTIRGAAATVAITGESPEELRRASCPRAGRPWPGSASWSGPASRKA